MPEDTHREFLFIYEPENMDSAHCDSEIVKKAGLSCEIKWITLF